MPEPEFSRRIRRKKISMVFQGSMSSFTPVYTIGYQLAETLRLHGYEGDPESRMVELMKMVRLDPSCFESTHMSSREDRSRGHS